jgi:hypothetical protein
MGGNYPDTINPRGIQREDISKLEDYFGPSNIPVNELTHLRTVAELLSAGFVGSSIGPAKTFIHTQIMESTGWWTIFAPVSRMTETTFITIQQWFKEHLEKAPEDTAPKFITHKTETHVENLIRYKIGARFRVDFFKTKEGQQIYANTLYQIASATFATMKEITILAILNSKQYWRERNDTRGNGLNPMDATARERRDFGALSKNDRGIYFLFSSISDIFQTENLKPSIMIVPRGILKLVAFSDFESKDASIRGEATINDRLVRAGESMKRIFPEFTIFEDSIWTSDQVDRDMLYKRTTIGQWFFLDGSEIRKKCDPCETEEDILTIQVPALPANAMEKIGIKKAINHSIRYDSNGQFHPHFNYVSQNLAQICEVLGFKIPDQMVDPYMFKISTDVGDVWKAAEYYGDIDPRYFTIRQMIDFGSRASDEMDRVKVLTDSMKESIRKLMELKEILSSPDDILSDSAQGYWFAIESNPENRVDLATKPSYFLNSNYYGSVQLPHIEDNAGGRKIYVLDPNLPGQRLYVHAIKASGGRPDASENTTVGFALLPIITLRGANSGEQRTNFVADYPDMITNDEKIPVLVPAPSRPYGYSDVTGLRTLAQLYKNSDHRGWDEDILRQAYEGMGALDTYFSYLEKLFPQNDWFNPKFLPLHLKTGSEEDSRNSAITNLFGEQKYPVMIRISKASGEDLKYRRTTIPGAILNTTISFSDAKLNDILNNMGFDNVAAVEQASEPGRLSLTNAEFNAENDRLLDILKSGKLSPENQNELLENNGEILFSNYANVENSLGSSYNRHFVDKYRQSGDYSQFAYFWKENISNETDIDKQVKLLDNILSLSRYPENVASLNQGYIDSIKSGVSSNKRKNTAGEVVRNKIEKSRESSKALGNSRSYINSRLVLDRQVFSKLYQRVKNNPNLFSEVYFSVIRPSDPQDSTTALAGYTSNNIVDSKDNLLNGLEELSFSAIRYKSRGAGTLDHPGLLKTSHVDFNEYEDTYIPNQFYRQTDGPLTKTIIQPVDNGSCPPVDAAVSIVSRPWVIRRLQEITRLVTDPFVAIPAKLFVLSRVHKDTIFNWIDNNLPQPHRCMIYAQPWIQFTMAAAIAGIPGSSTAELGYNHEDTILQLDGMIKDWTLHFTIYLGCFIYDPRNFMVVHEVAFAGYIGGYDTNMFDDPESFEANLLTADNLNQNKSMFVFDCGGNLQRNDIPDPLSLNFKYDDRQTIYRLDTEIVASDIPQIPCAIYYSSFWGFHQLNSTTDTTDRTTYLTEVNSNYVGTLMFSGSQLNYTPSKKDQKTLYIGTGHVGMFFFYFFKMLMYIIASILPPFRDIFAGIEVDSREDQKRAALVC